MLFIQCRIRREFIKGTKIIIMNKVPIYIERLGQQSQLYIKGTYLKYLKVNKIYLNKSKNWK